MSAAAGIVVTEMKTPISVLTRASVSETRPTIPARTATTTEKTSGVSMAFDTGRTPSVNAVGSRSAARIMRPKRNVAPIAIENPMRSPNKPRRIAARSL